jgi:uncharacterized OsmC-like protein
MEKQMGVDYTGTVRTYGTSMANSTTKVGKFEIFMDEPEVFGGNDSAPGPLDFLLAAHGGCINFMTFFIAKEMNIPIEAAEIKIQGKLDTSKFAGKDMTPRAGYQDIAVTIKVTTSAPEADIERLRKAVEDRCPVSDNITHATPVSITMSRVQ